MEGKVEKIVILPHGWTEFSRKSKIFFGSQGYKVTTFFDEIPIDKTNQIEVKKIEREIKELLESCECILILGPIEYMHTEEDRLSYCVSITKMVSTFIVECLRKGNFVYNHKLIGLFSLGSILPKVYENDSLIIEYEWSFKGLLQSKIFSFAKKGIETMLLQIGLLEDTPLISTVLNNYQLRREYKISERDIISYDELLDALEFFVSEEASYFYGSILNIDKGAFIK